VKGLLSTNGKQQRGPGAPTKLLNPRLRRAVLKSIALGMPLGLACKANGISDQTLVNFRKAYPDFDEEMEQARTKSTQRDLKVVDRCVQHVDPTLALRAATWRLTHLPGSAEHFSENSRVHVTGDVVQNNITVLLWPHQQQPQISDTASKTNGNGNGHPS